MLAKLGEARRSSAKLGEARPSSPQERRAYLTRRLRRLHGRVLGRVEALSAAEEEAGEKLRALASALRARGADSASRPARPPPGIRPTRAMPRRK